MQYLYLLCVLLPIVTGAGILVLRKRFHRRSREMVVLASACLTSLCGLALLWDRPGELTLLRLSDTLSLSFRLDSLGMVFVAILAVLWPIAAPACPD